jgi:hypothetical protein
MIEASSFERWQDHVHNRDSAERNAGFGMSFTVTLPIHPDAVP